MHLPFGYQESIVTPKFSRNAEAFWSFAAQKEGASIVLPDGRCDIILRYNIFTDTAPVPVITGPGTMPYEIKYTTGDSWIGVRLRPINGAQLWQSKMNGAANKVLFGTAALEVLPSLAQIARSELSFESLLGVLNSISKKSHSFDKFDVLSETLDAIHVSGGRLRIEKLATLAKCSVRRLYRMFRGSVGLSPKTYSQIIQFHRALRLIQKEQLSITAAAFEGGYADHAHLTRSFRRYGGFAPSDIPGDLSFPDFFPS